MTGHVPLIEPRFHERQHIRMLWVWALLLFIAVGGWIVFGGYLFFELDLGDDPPPRWLAGLLLAIFGVGFPLLLLAFRLDVTVDDDELTLSMWPGHRRRVLRVDIASAAAVTYRPMRDYLGWGMKWMPGKGWCYTVQGNRGVRVELRTGTKFLVGSERAEDLAAVLAPDESSQPGADTIEP